MTSHLRGSSKTYFVHLWMSSQRLTKCTIASHHIEYTYDKPRSEVLWKCHNGNSYQSHNYCMLQ